MKTVADQFAETLAAAGVKRIYGIVGDSLNGLTDAIRRQGKIEWVHVRHEEVAAFAAGAEAHLTGGLTDFPYRQFYPRGAGVRIVQVDMRPEQIGRRAPVDLGVVGDVRATLERVLPLIRGERDRTHLGRATAHYRKARQGLDDLAVSKPGRRPIHPQQVAKAISDQAAADAVFTCDVGLPTVWAARYLAAEMVKGFTLYMVKAVFNGRADDLVDLARSNLWA
jgi:thiamine pyrophosphate-dependent acetolactate synthase large subunit-like protein